ncbi:UNVERIFIED_CONTAM: hypothetical protein Slati_3922000 [Sesamum latifolium]|uniref:Reverse transcriptase Ty1/copia-type domain-containing protein n=1 Tax=Sesamum latifolium TaxID=2727402 RepID=A0AAW2TR64_9LAMI
MEFTSKMEDFGFFKSKLGYCLFTKNTVTSLLVLLVYVHDILVARALEKSILEVKAYLDSLFSIKDLGVAKYFLGLEIARSLQGVAVTQSKYIRDMIADAGMSGAKPATTLLPIGIKCTSEAGDALANLELFRRLVWKLLYLGFIGPNISHASQQLSNF